MLCESRKLSEKRLVFVYMFFLVCDLFNIFWLRSVKHKFICKYKLYKRRLPVPPPPPPLLTYVVVLTDKLHSENVKEVVLKYLNTGCFLSKFFN